MNSTGPLPLHIVFVIFKRGSESGAFRRVRYIDSQWADEKHACARKSELEHSLQMFDVEDFLVTIKRGLVADAVLQPTAPLSAADPVERTLAPLEDA